MATRKANPVYALLGYKGLNRYCDFLEYPLGLELVREMYPKDQITKMPEHFVLHRVSHYGKSIDLWMPKNIMEYDGQTREAFRYTSCDKIDDLLGFEDVAQDYNGMRICKLGAHKYETAYLSIAVDPKSTDESLIATIAHPGPGTKILGCIAGSTSAGVKPIFRMLEASEILFDIVMVDKASANVVFMVDADVKGTGSDAKEAWQAYWGNVIHSISYHVQPGGYG